MPPCGIHGQGNHCVCQCHDFQIRGGHALGLPCNDLHDEPQGLDDSKAFGKCVALALVVQFVQCGWNERADPNELYDVFGM